MRVALEAGVLVAVTVDVLVDVAVAVVVPVGVGKSASGLLEPGSGSSSAKNKIPNTNRSIITEIVTIYRPRSNLFPLLLI